MASYNLEQMSRMREEAAVRRGSARYRNLEECWESGWAFTKRMVMYGISDENRPIQTNAVARNPCDVVARTTT